MPRVTMVPRIIFIMCWIYGHDQDGKCVDVLLATSRAASDPQIKDNDV